MYWNKNAPETFKYTKLCTLYYTDGETCILLCLLNVTPLWCVRAFSFHFSLKHWPLPSWWFSSVFISLLLVLPPPVMLGLRRTKIILLSRKIRCPYTLSPFTLSPVTLSRSLCLLVTLSPVTLSPVTLSPGHFVPRSFSSLSLCPQSLCPLVTLSPHSLCPRSLCPLVTLSPVTSSPIFDFWNDMIWRSIYFKAISEWLSLV
jgi:hypothetical protein